MRNNGDTRVRMMRSAPDPPDALRAYENDRLLATSELVLRNRRGGPESVIGEVERRAPSGFARIEDVIDAATTVSKTGFRRVAPREFR
jgi:hypothetical protein